MIDNSPINLLRPNGPNLPKDPSPKKRSTLYFFITVVALLFLFWFVRQATLERWPKEAAAYDPVTLKPVKVSFFDSVKNLIFHSGNVLEGQNTDRVNILLLGIGGPGHDGPYLSDTNIIVSLKPSANEVALISIPRDLGVEIDKYGWRKINNANAFGENESPGNGGEYARKIFESTFKIEIPYYVRIDFKAFEELIDTVGGVTIEVPKTFIDTQFPGPNYSYQTISFQAGTERMNGARALTFARSRHGNNGEGSDFARSRRQELVLQALRNQILSLGTYSNPAKIQSILNTLSSHVQTNLDFGQLMYMGSMAKDLGDNTTKLVIDNSANGYLVNTITESGAFMLLPKSGNFDSIISAIQNVFEPTSSVKINLASQKSANLNYKLEVQNGTWRAGLASKIESRLTASGFEVISIGNSLKRPIEKTAVFLINSKDTKLAKQLKIEFGVEPIAAIPEWLTEEYDNPNTFDDERGMKYHKEADALIILGNDVKE